jgi:hypothetical protein
MFWRHFKIWMYEGTKATIQIHDYQLSRRDGRLKNGVQNRKLRNHVLHEN